MRKQTVAILTGGESRRMGTPKQQSTLPTGQTMLECMIGFGRTLSDQVVLVGSGVAGLLCIPDRRENQGPVAGIEALLESDIDDRYLVIGCDMPQLTLELITPLLQCDQSAVYTHNDTIFGLPVVVHSSDLQACTDYLDSGKRSIKGFVSIIPHDELSICDETAALLHSINTPDDLNKFAIE